MTPEASVVALVVLPERYNMGAPGLGRSVEEDKFERTMAEIAARFGGGVLWRFRREAPKGFWWDRGVLYRDEMSVLEVDLPNDASAKRWLAGYARETLLERFGQEAIYIKFVGPIQIDLVRIDRST